jgi:hypothetical protein
MITGIVRSFPLIIFVAVVLLNVSLLSGLDFILVVYAGIRTILRRCRDTVVRRS